MKHSLILTILSVILFFYNQTSQGQPDKQQNLGVVHFETSCNKAAQEHFEHGLAMLHHMMYAQAAGLFNKAVDADPDCAIACWGIAMTNLHPLWHPPTDEEFEKGFSAIKKAVSKGAPTEIEQDYIKALHNYYTTAEEAGHRKGLKNWENSLENLYKKYPEDIDAGAFYGLSLLATAPAEDETFSQQRKAGALLEKLHEKAPQHPGLFHYVIHAYDNPVLAEKGIEFAHEYDKLAPSVPHALHMPSHIFVRVGKWDESINWNKRSAEAALEQSEDKISLHHAHAMDYLMYAYLQQGRDENAAEVLDELNSVGTYESNFATAYAIAATHARYLLERREWEKAAEFTLNDHSDFPWKNFPQYEAIIWWARGLGAAKTKDFVTAQKAVKMLNQFHRQTLDKDEDYWALLVDAQRKTVKAWILYGQGKYNEALALMHEAADQEDSVDKHPVTPGEVLPARELLGDMLLMREKPEEALAAYNAALEISPNRFNSLFGAGKAAELAGNTDLAKTYYAKLHKIAAPEKSARPQMEHAVSFLEEK